MSEQVVINYTSSLCVIAKEERASLKSLAPDPSFYSAKYGLADYPRLHYKVHGQNFTIWYEEGRGFHLEDYANGRTTFAPCTDFSSDIRIYYFGGVSPKNGSHLFLTDHGKSIEEYEDAGEDLPQNYLAHNAIVAISESGDSVKVAQQPVESKFTSAAFSRDGDTVRAMRGDALVAGDVICVFSEDLRPLPGISYESPRRMMSRNERYALIIIFPLPSFLK